jgi:hypothetical protein
MYALYLATDAVQIAVAWVVCGAAERRLVRKSAVFLPLLPFYRMAVYFFRMSGILRTLSEQPRWKTSVGWVEWLNRPALGRLQTLWRRFVAAWAE